MNEFCEITMKDYKIKGGGDVQLHVVETGNASGPPIFFIHGFSQSWLAWRRTYSGWK
jgi:pimeloyl-ACP methyl ester carboxylesterase